MCTGLLMTGCSAITERSTRSCMVCALCSFTRFSVSLDLMMTWATKSKRRQIKNSVCWCRVRFTVYQMSSQQDHPVASSFLSNLDAHYASDQFLLNLPLADKSTYYIFLLPVRVVEGDPPVLVSNYLVILVKYTYQSMNQISGTFPLFVRGKEGKCSAGRSREQTTRPWKLASYKFCNTDEPQCHTTHLTHAHRSLSFSFARSAVEKVHKTKGECQG